MSVVGLVSAGVLLTVALSGGLVERPEVQQYVAEIAAEHNFDPQALNELLGDANHQQKIIDAISRPAERTWAWHEYRDLFVQPDRVQQGVEFWQQHAETLARAEEAYGVPPEYVLAILGVETRFGRIMGGYRVLDALTTLAFDYPPRADFFRSELTEFLLLCREEGKDPRALLGSYAGAMGFGQFISSSYRRYAVDFDNDGLRDIWQNPTDAIGSIANYFAQHGWQGELPVVVPIPKPSSEVQALANQELEPNHTLASLAGRGVQIVASLPPQTRATVLRMQLQDGERFFLGLNDFYVITRYNHSRLYAMAVHELSQEIKRAYQQRAAAQA